ncbi:MAG: Lactose transport system permease protein LacF [Firmicutes bacterium ADurb.BinA052]|nr:MAG: Lactose transport system permease protein LacF [Firmicutes bacterium ADurb.BinA052]
MTGDCEVVSMHSKWGRGPNPYVYLIPSLVLLGMFTYYPMLYSLYISFFSWDIFTPQPVFCGFDNYVAMFGEPVFWLVLKNTLMYTVVTIPITMAISLLLAVLLNENPGWMRNLYRVACFYPTMIPAAAAGMLWVWLFNPGIGLVNYYLKKLGVPTVEWLYDMKWALPAIMIVSIWKNFGYYMLIYLAGLQGISRELYECCDIQGAGFWARLRYITLPLLSSTSLFVVIVSLINSFQVFDLAHVMTQGGPADRTNTLVYYIYQNAFRFWNMGQASALTVVFVLFLLALIAISMRFMERGVYYEV